MTESNAKQTGLRLRQSLLQVLDTLPAQAETKLVEGVSRCFGRGHCALPEEASTDQTVALVKDFVQQLEHDPTRRHFVVDRDSLVTDDAGWLTVAQQQQCSSSSGRSSPTSTLQWAITTTRSLERSVFDQCFAGGDWKIQHADGPRGSAVVSHTTTTTRQTTGCSNKDNVCCQQAFFSDMPKCVIATGRQLAVLYPQQIVVRVLRTAPRASLTDSLKRVLQQQSTSKNNSVPDNVFTLWIRHHERVQDLPGMGRYRYERAVVGKKDQRRKQQPSVLDLLTDIVEDEEDPERPTSPLAHDFVQASQANFQRCRPPTPTTVSTTKTTLTPTTTTNKPSPLSTTVADTNDVETRNIVTGKDEAKAMTDTVTKRGVELGTMQGGTSGEADNSMVSATDARSVAVTHVAQADASVVSISSERSMSPRKDALSLLGSPEKPKLLGTDPMGLAMAMSVSKEMQSIDDDEEKDIAYDTLEIKPTFSFDEEDITMQPPQELVVDIEKRSEEVLEPEEKKDDTFTPPSLFTDQETALAEEPTTDAPISAISEIVAETRSSSNQEAAPVNSQPEPPTELRKEETNKETKTEKSNAKSSAPSQKNDAKEREVLDVNKNTAEPSTVNETNPDSSPDNAVKQQSTLSPRQKRKTVYCVGCEKRKPKVDFSNSQLKKKKNNRCLDCVRANRLGSSNNNQNV